MTFYLKFSGAPEADIAALKAAHPDMVRKDDAGKDILGSIYTPDIALHYDDQTPAGPFVMVKFLKKKRQKLGPLGANLTRMWESGEVPLIWAGE